MKSDDDNGLNRSSASPRSRLLAHVSRRRAEWLTALVAVICYANAIPNDYCYDDVPIVAANKRVNAPGQWLSIWTTDHWSASPDAPENRDLLYRPVALTSYRLVRLLLGSGPAAQHLLNILLHAAACVLVVWLGLTLGGSNREALAAGILFAVLPIHTETVVSVVGRADLLATLGVLAALLAHRRGLVETTSARRAQWMALAAVAAFTALGSKESAISLVVLLPIFHLFWNHKAQRVHDGDGDTARSGLRLSHIGYMVVPLALYLLLRYNALGGRFHQQPAVSKTINVLVDAPMWQHILGVVQLWGMYWAKTVWPAVLSCTYSVNGLRLATNPFDTHVVFGLIVTVFLLAASFITWQRGRKTVALLALALAASYAPTANALILLQVFFAERIWYLPSVFVVILIAIGAARLLPGKALAVVGLVVVSGMVGRCWVRCFDWRSNETLFAAAYRDQPQAVTALYLRGQWLVRHHQPKRGIERLKKAIEIDLGYTDAHRALGRAYLDLGVPEGAVHHLQIADMQAPGHRATESWLAQARQQLALPTAAPLQQLIDKAQRSPQDLDAEIAVIKMLRDSGRTAEALRRFQTRGDAFGDRATWQIEYAVTLLYLNRIDEAVERYRQAVVLDSRHVSAMVELSMLLLERRAPGDMDEAWRLADRAKAIAPNDPAVLVCQAELHAVRGDIEQALAYYQRAIEALPTDSDRRRLYQQRARVLGRK